MVGSEPTLSQADVMGLPATLEQPVYPPHHATHADALCLLSKHTHQVVTACDRLEVRAL